MTALNTRIARNEYGFTLLEVVVAIAVIALLGAIALVGYQKYTERAKASDIVLKYDAIRSGVGSTLAQASVNSCDELTKRLVGANLADAHAQLAYGFEAVTGGYRPVLTVCAKADQQGAEGVKVARGAHDTLASTGRVEKGAVLTDSVVSFALSLTDSDRPSCTVASSVPSSACGAAAPPVSAQSKGGAQLPPQAAAVAGGQSGLPAPACAPGQQLVAVTGAAPACVATCPPGQMRDTANPLACKAIPKVQASVMKLSGECVYVRPEGGNLNTGGPLAAFTLEMSFIGDGSTPAASGGAGPVMFNYGDNSNGHNAISLWNPRSLTVALQNGNYDTGVNLVDGNTHRVTVAWSSVTGTLSVYDNGGLVKTFAAVSTGKPISGGGSLVIGHKDNGGGNYRPNEAFNGQVFHTSFANVAVGAGQVAQQLSQVLQPTTGLLMDVRTQGTSIVDTTGRQKMESCGATGVVTSVDSNLVQP